ncbi:hypothetical protein AB0K14_19505 [Actinosynnema sp. NPDC050801]|uniref:hypothetical protein n=1 Tax=unclassified Actinosynnema TaxID=2637065 RepID=UPI0033CBAC44
MTAVAEVTSPPPTQPLELHANSVLSQDIITSASIIVESTSPAPVASFINPSHGAAEALAVVNKQVCHISRDRQTDSGWRATPLFSGQAADQVAACVPFQNTVYGFFVDSGGQLHSATLGSDGVTWSAPIAVTGGALSHPRVAYTTEGAAVIYGLTAKGDLVTAHQTGMTDPFVATVHDVQGALSGDDFQLCMTDEASFSILANIGGKAHTVVGDITQANVVGPSPVTQFTATVGHVALGYASPSGLGTTAIFVFVGQDEQKRSALHCWAQAGTSTAVVQKIGNGSMSGATGHVAEDGSLHVYAVDSELGLWVLHQSVNQPWRDDGTPNWAPFLPLDKGIGRVVSDMNPAAAPSLFAVDGGDFSLRLHELDATSRMWKTQQVLRHETKAYEVSRHRVEVRVVDANARALANHEVTVAVEKGCSAVEVWAGGGLHLVNEKGATLTTDIFGKLTMAITATEHGLACPNLVVSCEGLPEAATVRPAGGLHEYLSGKGTLNPTNPSDRGGGPLAPFTSDGATLKAAKVNGALLAPGASDSKDPDTATNVASAIQYGALVALGTPPPGVHGFGGSLMKDQTSFELFHDEAALRAHSGGAGLHQLGSFWDDLKHFFGDIFEGIKNFVVKVAHFVVDVARKIVEFTLDFAEFVGKALHLPIDGIEKAASFMHGFFNSVDADIDKVVEWLEALFDFGAIWRTKMAIQQSVEGIAPYLVGLAGQVQTVADGWFAQQKHNVNDAFDAIQKDYAGKTFSDLGHWQNPSAPTSNDPVAGKAAPTDVVANPHHNWLHDKVAAYPPDTSAFRMSGAVDDLWKTVESHLSDSGSEFQKALDKFRDAVWVTVTDPADFSTKAVPDLIEMAREVTLAVLDLMDTIVDAVVTLLGAGVEQLDKLFREELPLGFLNILWKWMAEAAGYPNDATLNMYSLGALAAAVPCTLVYKLVEGVEHEPFPTGKLPTALTGPMTNQLGSPMPWGCALASDITRMVQVIPATAADILASNCPGWLTGLNVVFSGAVWGLRHGYPDQWKELAFAAALSGPPLLVFTFKAVEAWRTLHKDDSNDIIAFLSTAAGLASLGYGIYLDSTQHQRPGAAIASILTAFPMMFGWLTLSPIRMNVELAPFAIASSVLVDFIGYLGGGLELLLDTVQVKGTQAVAEGTE